MLRTLGRTAATLLSFGLLHSAAAIDLGEYGKIMGDFRYRYEFVDQDGFDKNANANTARMRLGYMTPTYEGLTGYAEGELIQAIGAERFNSGLNGNTDYPSVNDPNDFALSQLYVNYAFGKGNQATLGRQYVVFDNQRFVGWSKFRQNDTVQDAARLTLKPVDELTLDYVYTTKVHRSPGSRLQSGTYDGDINLAHAAYKLPEDLTAIGYGYWLSFDEDIDTLSSRTLGSRWEWRPKDGWESLGGIAPLATVEFAEQEDMGNNPDSYAEWYNWFEIGGSKGGHTISAIYERLGGNGVSSVKMPIGTNHSFTGWIDRIDTTPADGLVDYQVWFKGPISVPWEGQKLGYEVQLHQFEADNTSDTYGQEVDLGLSYTPKENHTITAQLGHYVADELLSDTTKVWLYYDWKF